MYTWLEKPFESRDYKYSRSDIGRTPALTDTEGRIEAIAVRY